MSIDQLAQRLDQIEARLTSIGVTKQPDFDGYLQRLEARISEVEQRVLTLEALVRPVEGFDASTPALPGAVEVQLGSEPLADPELPQTVGEVEHPLASSGQTAGELQHEDLPPVA